MSEYLITDKLHNKRIFSPQELSEIHIPDDDPVAKIGIILPESEMIFSNTDNSEIEVVKIPVGDSGFQAVSPLRLDVELITVEGDRLGFIPYSDEIVEYEGVKPLSGEVLISNKTPQISLPQEAKENVGRILRNYLGLVEADYSTSAYFELLAKDESLEELSLRVPIRAKLGRKAIFDLVRSNNVQTDLSADSIVFMSKQEFDDISPVINGIDELIQKRSSRNARQIGSLANFGIKKFNDNNSNQGVGI